MSTPANTTSQHAEYEMVFEAKGVLEEKDAPHLRQDGIIRVIQGPKMINVDTLDGNTLVYAFLSVNEVNVPLVPDQEASRISPHCYKIRVPDHEFTITLDGEKCTPEIEVEFEKILKWFVTYQGEPAGKISAAAVPASAPVAPSAPPSDASMDPPAGAPMAADPAPAPASDAESVPVPQGRPSMSDRFDAAGARGVAFVEKVAGKVETKVNGVIDPKLESAHNVESRGEAKDVKLGGKVTSTVLGTTAGAVGKVAGAANSVSEKASDVVGTVLGKNPIMKNLGKAEEGSKRFRFHRTLTSGMVAVGNVYVTADERGRQIVSTAGENSAEVLRARYGKEVSGAARDSTHIAMDSYRIMRFPAKFGASALLKGAAKASVTSTAKNAKE